MKDLQQKNIVQDWFWWHFYETPHFLFATWIHFLEFALDYFSIPTLLQTLFAPWHRLTFGYPKGFNIGEFFSSLISNIFSRIIGAICRLVLIAAGILFFFVVLLGGAFVFLIWLLLPVFFASSIVFLFFR